jgi:hypothetical protein
MATTLMSIVISTLMLCMAMWLAVCGQVAGRVAVIGLQAVGVRLHLCLLACACVWPSPDSASYLL